MTKTGCEVFTLLRPERPAGKAEVSNDKISSTFRGHCVADGAHFTAVCCDLLGTEQNRCRGKGGSVHIADQFHGSLDASSIVGDFNGVAAGQP